MKLLSLLLLIFVVVSYGCGDSHNGHGSGGLEFTEVSEGIPASMQFRENVTFYDLDDDGLKDMITPAPRSLYTNPKVFLNKGDHWIEITEECTFPPEVDYYGWVEADSRGNLYFAVHGRGVFALRKTGFCAWENASDGLPPAGEFSSRALAIGDINSDGFIDIAAISDSFYATPYTIRVFTGDGSFGWSDASDGLPVQISGDHISLSDINMDGHIDILVDSNNQSRNSVVWYGNGKGSWADAGGGLPDGIYYSITPLKNGFLSMLYNDVFSGGPFIFILDEGLWRLIPETGLEGSWFISAIGLSDLNGDGIEDIVLGDDLSRVLIIFTGEGEHNFSEALSLSLPLDEGFIRNINISDINGDGRPDIAVNMASADNLGTIKVFLQK